MKTKSLLATAALSSFFCISSAEAALLVAFNFNNSQAFPSTTTFGGFLSTGSVEVFDATTETITPASSGLYASTASLDLSGLNGQMTGSFQTGGTVWGASSVSTALSAVPGDNAGRSLGIAGLGNNNASIVFTVSTNLAEGISISYDAQSNTGGATTHTWDYSLNGSDWFSVAVLSGHMTSSFANTTVNMSTISAIENQSMVMFRLTYSGATADNAPSRIDNLQVNALNIIPEPTVALLGGFGLLALLRRRR
jgi:hypothetical protein